MKWDREAASGGLMLLVAFIALGFVLPWASVYGVNSTNLSEKIFAWVFLGILALIVILVFPKFTFQAVVGVVVVFLIIFLLGDQSGNCVPVVPGSCD
jgi:hypothetical protein